MLHWLWKEAELPLETVILMIVGLAMIVTGILLFPVSWGVLPYYENGLFGLMLFMYALQMITLGKTPFGEIPWSKGVGWTGVVIAGLGFLTCFIPGISGQVPRWLLCLCLGPGSLILLWQMWFSRERYWTWKQYGGIFTHLTYSCVAVYILSVCMAVMLWRPEWMATQMIAVLLLVYGVVLLYLTEVLRRIYCKYPGTGGEEGRPGVWPMNKAAMLLTGIFMILLGLVLLPVNLGLLPFAGSAQLGMLMILFALKMLADGNTPFGSFRRTWLIIAAGVLFAILGIVSCIIPAILAPALTWIIGGLNIIEGLITLGKLGLQYLKSPPDGCGTMSGVLKKLLATQVILGLLSIIFGTSMWFADLIPGLVVGLVLAVNGGVLLYLLKLLVLVEHLGKNN